MWQEESKVEGVEDGRAEQRAALHKSLEKLIETGDPEVLEELVLKLMAWMTTQLGGVVLSSTTVIRCSAPLLSIQWSMTAPSHSLHQLGWHASMSSFLGTEPCKDPMKSR